MIEEESVVSPSRYFKSSSTCLQCLRRNIRTSLFGIIWPSIGLYVLMSSSLDIPEMLPRNVPFCHRLAFMFSAAHTSEHLMPFSLSSIGAYDIVTSLSLMQVLL